MAEHIGKAEDERAFQEWLVANYPAVRIDGGSVVRLRMRAAYDFGLARGEEKRGEPMCQEPCCRED